jgi:hypothetical protein
VLARLGRGVDADHAGQARGVLAGRLERLAHPDDGGPHRADRARVGDHHAGAAVDQHPDDLPGGAAGVDRDRDHARTEDAVVRRHELDAVGDRDHDAVAGHHAGGREAVRDPVGEVVEGRPRDGATGGGLGEGDALRLLARGRGQEIGDVGPHPGSLPHREVGTIAGRPAPRVAL